MAWVVALVVAAQLRRELRDLLKTRSAGSKQLAEGQVRGSQGIFW